MQDYYRITQVCEGVFRITAPEEGTYSELIVGREKAALIDTAYGIGDLPGAVRSVTELPLIILNTHSHGDHIGANGLFTEPIYMGQEDIPNTDYTNSRFFRQTMIDRVKNKPAGLDEKAYLARGVGDLRPCRDGDVYDLGGMRVRALAVPGHSVGSRAFYLEEKRFLYTGDNVGPVTLIYGFGSASRKDFLRSLDKMLALPFARIYGAHAEDPYTREQLLFFRLVAAEADYSQGVPAESLIKGGENARICCVKGMTPADRGKPGYAAVVIDPDPEEAEAR